MLLGITRCAGSTGLLGISSISGREQRLGKMKAACSLSDVHAVLAIAACLREDKATLAFVSSDPFFVATSNLATDPFACGCGTQRLLVHISRLNVNGNATDVQGCGFWNQQSSFIARDLGWERCCHLHGAIAEGFRTHRGSQDN